MRIAVMNETSACVLVAPVPSSADYSLTMSGTEKTARVIRRGSLSLRGRVT